MRCEQNEKHSQNDNLLQELVQILRIENVYGYQTKNVVLFKNPRYVYYQPKLRLRPGVRQRGNTARVHYLRPFRLRCYRSPWSFVIPRAWAFQVGILRTFSIKENCWFINTLLKYVTCEYSTYIVLRFHKYRTEGLLYEVKSVLWVIVVVSARHCFY